MAQLTCIVVTPENTALETEADFIALPLFDGEIGVAPGRAPLIGRLGFGELRLKRADKTVSFYIDGGFVQIADNVVSVLTSNAISAEKIDVGAAEKQLVAAQGAAPTDEMLAAQEKARLQARAQIRIGRRVR